MGVGYLRNGDFFVELEKVEGEVGWLGGGV